ncbi:hypothetical protein [Microbulbifer aggregans]|uniref:hypothetical protein n=1 Tax=Microbulbifer aggregans TaxID=1769779 RepID=UPI001CFD27E6|nr:hypothetical protein [Microbulbifer aggregans]
MNTFKRTKLLGICLAVSSSMTAMAQQSPFTGTAFVNFGSGLQGESQSLISVPVRVDLTGVTYTDKDANVVPAAIGAVRVEITYDHTMVSPIVENGFIPGGSSGEFSDLQATYIDTTGTQRKLVISATQTAEDSPTGLVHFASIPFMLLAESGDTTLNLAALDVLSPLAALSDGIIGGEVIPHTVTDGIITISAPTQGASMSSKIQLVGSDDSDGDGMSDTYELAYKLNPYSDADASLDSDSDGLSNLEESTRGTDPHYLRGDMNNDGVVDLVDVVIVKRIVVGLEQASPEQLEPGHGDINVNGIIDLGDAVVIERLAMGHEENKQESGE